MNRIDFRTVLEPPWTDLTPLLAGQVRAGLATPTTHVTVEQDGSPPWRVDVFEPEPGVRAFQQTLLWRRFLVIGHGAQVHLVSREAGTSRTFALDGYFGHLYPLERHLLVADAVRLRCFDDEGEQLWSSPALGVDGVLVHCIDDGIIEGDGEWDPPGGWRPFRVSLSTGLALPS